MLGEVAVDRGLEINQGVKDTPADSAAGHGREEGLDGIQPGAGDRRVVEGLARVPVEPRHHLGVLVVP